MTQNQIAYWQLLEAKRHNLQTEGVALGTLGLERDKLSETKRANLAQEYERHRAAVAQETIGWFNASETSRANRAKEAEAQRHNLATEDLSNRQLDESVRHNMTAESQQWATIGESRRHNLATESTAWYTAVEQRRHNVAGEMMTLLNTTENARHNLAVEKETSQHNRAVETESSQHNRATEAVEQQKAQTAQWQLEWNQWKYDTFGKYLDQSQTERNKAESDYVRARTSTHAIDTAGNVWKNFASGASSLIDAFIPF